MSDSQNTGLPERFTLYLPVSGECEDACCLATELLLCELFGGVTSFPARGTFRMKTGELKVEEIQVVECYCEPVDLHRHLPMLQNLAQVIARALDQESIAYALNGRMETLKPLSGCSSFSVPMGATRLADLLRKEALDALKDGRDQ